METTPQHLVAGEPRKSGPLGPGVLRDLGPANLGNRCPVTIYVRADPDLLQMAAQVKPRIGRVMDVRRVLLVHVDPVFGLTRLSTFGILAEIEGRELPFGRLEQHVG